MRRAKIAHHILKIVKRICYAFINTLSVLKSHTLPFFPEKRVSRVKALSRSKFCTLRIPVGVQYSWLWNSFLIHAKPHVSSTWTPLAKEMPFVYVWDVARFANGVWPLSKDCNQSVNWMPSLWPALYLCTIRAVWNFYLETLNLGQS